MITGSAAPPSAMLSPNRMYVAVNGDIPSVFTGNLAQVFADPSAFIAALVPVANTAPPLFTNASNRRDIAAPDRNRIGQNNQLIFPRNPPSAKSNPYCCFNWVSIRTAPLFRVRRSRAMLPRPLRGLRHANHADLRDRFCASISHGSRSFDARAVSITDQFKRRRIELAAGGAFDRRCCSPRAVGHHLRCLILQLPPAASGPPKSAQLRWKRAVIPR